MGGCECGCVGVTVRQVCGHAKALGAAGGNRRGEGIVSNADRKAGTRRRSWCGLRLVALWISLLVRLALTARAWEEPEVSLEACSTLATNLVTPHTPWARPYTGGTVHGVYFVYSWSEGMQTHAREAVELQQRLDIALDAAFLYNFYKEHWFGGDAGERRVARLMAEPREVFIFQDMPPSKLSTNALQDARTPFLKQVRDGAGVVLIGTDDGKLFSEAQALAEPPPLLAGTGVVKVYTVGKGRVAQMPARPRIGYRAGWEVEYDYWQEALTRAVLWAARREPVTQVQVAVEHALDRQKLPAKGVTVAWQGATASETALSVRLRRWDGETRELGTVTCDRADGQTVFELPGSRAGAYHVEVFARNGNGVRGWATAPLEITSVARIAALTLDTPHPLPERPPVLNPRNQQAWDAKMKARHDEAERRGIYAPYVEIGEPVAGMVAVAGAAPGQTLRLSLRDPRGRELVRQELSAADERRFTFKAEPWMPALLKVEATLFQGSEEVAYSYVFQRITQRRQGRFNFVLWDAPGDETLGPYALDKLAEMGVTAILHHTPAPLSASACGMSYVPWTGGNVHGRDAEQWPTPEYGEGFARHVLQSRGAGVLTYSLGDEGRISGMGDGPNTDAAFQAYLKSVYDSVEALNQSWGSQFQTFEGVAVKAARETAEAAAAAGLENHAAAYALDYFGGWNFVRMARKNRDWVRRVCADPVAGIGFEGSGNIYRGACDPELICRELDMWVPYTGISEEFVRSVAPRSFVRSSWIGYSRDAANHTGWYWRQIINGADSVWYWMWSAIGAWQGLQAPDLQAPAPVQAMLDDTRIVREGLGDLLLRYQQRHDGIAVLYSYPSLFVHGRGSASKSYATPHAAALAWQNVIHDLNMQYDFVTDRALSAGEVSAASYRVLVLPEAWALGDAAVSGVHRFVEEGGTVIADIRPARYDARCRQRPVAALDGLFGVAGGFAAAERAPAKIAGTTGLGALDLERPGKGLDQMVAVEPGVSVTDGQALGNAGAHPVCIVRAVGKGRAVLLNFTPSSAFTVRDDTRGLAGTAPLTEIPADVARFFLGLFHAAGVERAFTFTPYKQEKQPFFPNVKVQRWTDGEYQIAAFFRQTDTEARRGSCIPDAGSFPVSPQRAAGGRPYAPLPWVYDLRQGLTVGRANWFIVPIDPGRPAVYALLPGPLPPLAVEMPKQAKRGAPVTLQLAVPGARGLHAIKLRATLPDGQPVRFWDQTVQVAKEPVTVTLPLAFNDPAGEWTVTLTDLFGADTERRVGLTIE